MFGTAATQRGRAPQLPFMISRSSSAVVEGSTVTSFSSGGGGATAVLQSEMTSALVGEPTNVSRSAPPAAVKRETIMMSFLYLGERCDFARRTIRFPTQTILGFVPPAH